HSCQGLRLGGAFPPVGVLEPYDVFELRRRDLDDRCVFHRAHAMDGSRRKAERRPGSDDLAREDALAGAAELELDPALEDIPRLVLDLVELEAERLACLHDEQLSGVVVCERPDELVAPRLLHLALLGCEPVDSAEIWGAQVVMTRHGVANLTHCWPRYRPDGVEGKVTRSARG